MEKTNRIKKLFQKLISGIRDSIRRFPVTVALAWSISLVLLVLIHIEDSANDKLLEWLIRIVMILFMGVPISLTLHILYENIILKVKYVIGLWIVSSAFLIAYLFLFLPPEQSMVDMIRYFAFTAAFWAMFLSMPYFFNRKNLGIYSLRLAGRFLIVALYGLVIWGGLSLTILSFEILMNVNFYQEIYVDLFVITAGIFLSLMLLAGVPSKDDKVELSNIPKIFRTLLVYAVMPIISVYTLILYIYSMKLLIDWALPDGIIGNLVIWYAMIGTLIMFITNRIQLEYKWSQIFAKWFPRVILLPMALLISSLLIRVGEYGFTESRISALIVAIWVSGIMLYYAIVPHIKRKIVLIPLTMGIIAILMVSGPWNIFNISRNSQNNRLKEILMNNNMIVNEKIVANANASNETKEQVTSILEYFRRFHELDQIALLDDEYEYKDMKEVFGFEEYYFERSDYSYYEAEQISGILDIQGFEYYIPTLRESANIGTTKGELVIENNGDNVLSMYLDKEEILIKDLNEYIDVINNTLDDSAKNQGHLTIPREDMIFIEENEIIEVKIMINSISINNDRNYFSYDLLIRMK